MDTALPTGYPLLRLPAKIEMTLFLIKEELKNRKFTQALEAAGFDTTFCCTDFGTLIITAMGFQISDQLYALYFKLMDKYCERCILSDPDSLTQQALNIYIDLEIERRSGK